MLWVLILFQWLLDAKISGGVSLLYVQYDIIDPCVRDLMQHDIIGGSKCVPVDHDPRPLIGGSGG